MAVSLYSDNREHSILL